MTLTRQWNFLRKPFEKIDAVIPRYPEKRSAVPDGYSFDSRRTWGQLSDETCEWIAEKLELQPINIRN